MATHPRNSMPERMRELLAYHEHAADALRTSLQLLNGHATQKKQDQHQDLFDAVQLDAARRRAAAAKAAAHKRGPYKKKRAETPTPAVRVLARPPKKGKRRGNANKPRDPQIVLNLLAHFDTDEPRPAFKMGLPGAGGRIGNLVQAGFLKRKGKGYIRTSKPYPAAAPLTEP